MRIGQRIAEFAYPGLVIGLEGALGTGKTTFVRGLAEGMRLNDDLAVSSPTFVLVHEYEGRLPLIHVDAYRLDPPERFSELGPEEWFSSPAVVLVEWADRVRQFLPEERLEIALRHVERNRRRIAVTAIGDEAVQLLSRTFGDLQQAAQSLN